MNEDIECRQLEQDILVHARGPDYVELESYPSNLPEEIQGSRHHAFIGLRGGKVVEDEPFDEIRLIENIGTDKQVKYKGVLK